MARSAFRFWFTIIVIPTLLVVGALGYLAWRQSVSGVRAAFDPEPKWIGAKTPLAVDLRAARGSVSSVEIRLRQGSAKVVVLQQAFTGSPAKEQRVALQIAGGTLGLREGAATLEVLARDTFWRPIRVDDRPILTTQVTLDFTPPSLEIIGATRYWAQGGGGLVVLRSKGASRVAVNVGTLAFPAYPAGAPDSNFFVDLVALPWNYEGAPLTAVAQDEAGNTVTRAVSIEVKPRRFKTDTIEIKDDFLERKLPELLPERGGAIPQGELLQAFLTVNRDKRKQAEETKRVLAAKTQPKPLWDGAFVQPRNTKVFSNFAETRTYRYHGQDVDTQIHFGYDLAATRHGPVPAANSGVVVHAGPLSIYGNAVVVDHGLGLQTLYGHLSSIEVKEGDQVAKEQELGRSGSTGLALGDHLHYEVLINGVSVTPLEWWDGKWIRDHVNRPLREASVPLLASVTPATAEKDASAAPTPRRRRGARSR
ncbi:MAG TPA: peptidoglycan DD-metalloendopeptidase family protein [Candidatus Bathyarchaeia archaeon]|nr:peptidoglycan DD-metalloendopeptidase family protein [Candidatus Bathyarchaeia archaeon]